MFTSLSPDRFLEALSRYEQEVWPLPVLACLLGLVMVLLALHRVRAAGRFIASLLALFWVWVGVEYHAVRLGHLLTHPELFSAMFVAQGMLLFWHGVLSGRLVFSFRGGLLGAAGGFFMAYALAGYPLLGEALGRGAWGTPMFGISPGPTTIFTLGLLLWSEERVPWDLLPIPLLWAALGAYGSWRLGLAEELMLGVAGAATAGLLAMRGLHIRRQERADQQACRA